MTTRLGTVLGLLLAAAIGAWWLVATRVALIGGGATATLATQALFALGLARPMLASVVGLRIAARGGFADGVRTTVPLMLAAWPLAALAWLASTDSLSRALAIEAGLLAYALLVAVLGHGLHRAMRDQHSRASVATILGVALAGGLWLASDLWRPVTGG